MLSSIFPFEHHVLIRATDYLWTWQFTKVLHLVMTSAFGAKSPTYAKILELDRRVRDSHVPPKLRVACGAAEENPPASVTLTMQRMFVTLWKESSEWFARIRLWVSADVLL